MALMYSYKHINYFIIPMLKAFRVKKYIVL